MENVTLYPDTDKCIELMKSGEYPREKLLNDETIIDEEELCAYFAASVSSEGRYSFLSKYIYE